ncbi:MAG: hypothetical protein KF746_04180 [Chitinophagaceae bacterium]|nr:hypothetical protein [Chitinophagaceae bacterium]
MKKALFLAALTAVFAACGNESKTESEGATGSDVTVTPAETNKDEAPATVTYTAEEGDVMWKEGKLLVYKDGNWSVAEKDITLNDGTVISLKGDISKDGKTINIKEGETVKKTGQFFDKAGNAVSNAWDAAKEAVKDGADAVKEGVKDAAGAVKEGAQDAGKAVKEETQKLKDKAKKAVE